MGEQQGEGWGPQPLLCLPGHPFPAEARLAGSGGDVLGPGWPILKVPETWVGRGARALGSGPSLPALLVNLARAKVSPLGCRARHRVHFCLQKGPSPLLNPECLYSR